VLPSSACLSSHQEVYSVSALASSAAKRQRLPSANWNNWINWKSLPTVFRSGPYRLFFYSADHQKPAHVHVEREEMQMKVWLDPVRLANSRGFRRSEIREIEKLVADNAGLLLEAWHEYFGN